MDNYTWIVIVFLAILIVLPFIVNALAVYIRRKTTEFVISKSKALKEVAELSKNYNFHQILETYFCRAEQKSPAAFRKFDYDKFFSDFVEHDVDEFQRIIEKAKFNAEKYAEYMTAYDFICKNEVTEWPSKRKQKIEKQILEEGKKTAVCEINVCVKNHYRSPKGRNEYEDSRTFSQERVVQVIEKVRRSEKHKHLCEAPKEENVIKNTFSSQHDVNSRDNVNAKYLETWKEILLLLQKLNSGCSVTKRISQVKQPTGGYINPKYMTTISVGEGIEGLDPNASLHPTTVGLAVDYMTRFMLGTELYEAFRISIKGAHIIGEDVKAERLLSNIKGLDYNSVVSAVKLCGFDVCYRAGKNYYKPVDEIVPDNASVENVIIMVNRALHFFEIYGPKVLDGFTFEGGYTDVVSTGDGDFITKDTLWDFKVSKYPPKKEQTLQLLMYWRMGLHSIHPEFKSIKYLGIYNPKLNIVSRIAVEDISEQVINEIETDVIGYKKQ